MNYDFIPDRPIAFNRDFVKLGIGITGALLLSQAVYWCKRTNDNDGWFYKTADEWQEETGMTRNEQETARRRLRDLGILEEKRAGLPAKLYYRINTNKLVELLKSRLSLCDNQEANNVPIITIQRVHTESTTDNMSPKGSSAVFSVDVIAYLNAKTKTNYRQGIKKTISLIDARRKEGFTLDDFKTVIDKKTAQWKNDSKMSAYLRPETLFGTKFEGYLNEIVAPPATTDRNYINDQHTDEYGERPL